MVSGFHIFGIVDCVDLDLYDLHFCTTSASTQCKKFKKSKCHLLANPAGAFQTGEKVNQKVWTLCNFVFWLPPM